MKDDAILAAALALREAASSGNYVPPLRETYPELNVKSAYAIQQLNTAYRVGAGERVVGCKIGLTSIAVQQQLGVDQPDFGMLFDSMSFADSQTIPYELLNQPKIEAEIAFVLGRDLDLPNPTQLDVLNAIDYILPALEIVGSRIDKWNIRIGDTIADNASSSAFVLGNVPRQLHEVDLRLCGMTLVKLGEPVSTGAGAACLGNPINAVIWLARVMRELGTPLEAGSVILSGALGPMVEVQPGDSFEAKINGVGSVRAVFGRNNREQA